MFFRAFLCFLLFTDILSAHVINSDEISFFNDNIFPLYEYQDHLAPAALSNRSFTIDYTNNCFRKDGTPFRYVSGSMHYFRVHPTDWADRLAKLRYAGLNAVQTYVEWSSHEPEPGQYDFSGILDLGKFLQEAQNQGLLVILRVGPYICSERDMGGLPYWLLRLHPNIRLRSSDPNFVRHLDAWLLRGLLPRIKPFLYENGGPIIMLQVENEYGNYYSCDYSYTSHLRQVFRLGLGHAPVLFTTDNGSHQSLRCGKIPLVYATVDFGVADDPLAEFGAQRVFEPNGPLVNSEFYSGWLDHWGQPHQTRGAQEFSRALDRLLAMTASVNIYMFHGGTNFGLTAGSNMDSGFQSCPTSYDYDAPVSEAGDMTAKFSAIRDVVGKYLPLPDGPPPTNSTKGNYGRVALSPMGHPLSLATEGLLPAVTAPYPLTFEQLGVNAGLVAYFTTINFTTADPSLLVLGALHDRGYVYVNGSLRGTVARGVGGTAKLPLRTRPGDILAVLVESMGRVSVGMALNDVKGLTTNVTLNSRTLTDWTMVPMPLTAPATLLRALRRLGRHRGHKTYGKELETGRAGFYEGVLTIPAIDGEPKDTFLRLDGWTKGIVWLNNFCLGRYWPVMGPQATLFVPRGVLQAGANHLLVLELEHVNCAETTSRNDPCHPDICRGTNRTKCALLGCMAANRNKCSEGGCSDDKCENCVSKKIGEERRVLQALINRSSKSYGVDSRTCFVKFVDVPDINSAVPVKG